MAVAGGTWWGWKCRSCHAVTQRLTLVLTPESGPTGFKNPPTHHHLPPSRLIQIQQFPCSSLALLLGSDPGPNSNSNSKTGAKTCLSEADVTIGRVAHVVQFRTASVLRSGQQRVSPDHSPFVSPPRHLPSINRTCRACRPSTSVTRSTTFHLDMDWRPSTATPYIHPSQQSLSRLTSPTPITLPTPTTTPYVDWTMRSFTRLDGSPPGPQTPQPSLYSIPIPSIQLLPSSTPHYPPERFSRTTTPTLVGGAPPSILEDPDKLEKVLRGVSRPVYLMLRCALVPGAQSNPVIHLTLRSKIVSHPASAPLC